MQKADKKKARRIRLCKVSAGKWTECSSKIIWLLIMPQS
jgi:hypothetical protein